MFTYVHHSRLDDAGTGGTIVVINWAYVKLKQVDVNVFLNMFSLFLFPRISITIKAPINADWSLQFIYLAVFIFSWFEISSRKTAVCVCFDCWIYFIDDYNQI